MVSIPYPVSQDKFHEQFLFLEGEGGWGIIQTYKALDPSCENPNGGPGFKGLQVRSK